MSRLLKEGVLIVVPSSRELFPSQPEVDLQLMDLLADLATENLYSNSSDEVP